MRYDRSTHRTAPRNIRRSLTRQLTETPMKNYRTVERLSDDYQIIQFEQGTERNPSAVYGIMKPNGWIDARRFETVTDACIVVDKMKAEKQPKTITIENTWKTAMPVIILALTNGTPKGVEMAKRELMELAGKLDALNIKHTETLTDA